MSENGMKSEVPLLGVSVIATIVAGHARVVVRQRYRNDETRPLEVLYTMPLPSQALVVAFAMETASRRLEGKVFEREEAFQRYDDALTSGHGAALFEQERPNVFTVNLGNLLPGEETSLEIEYIEPVLVDEGSVRWTIPTAVAPRYVPGKPSGDRTGHGTEMPTTDVPDADRISPPIADVDYGLALEVTFDLGELVTVESPSHPVVVDSQGSRTTVRFAQKEAPLDRDVVLVASPESRATELASMATVSAHRGDGGGAFAFTLVPDLGGERARPKERADVVFLLDRSGSMGGSAIQEARTALRLCLRQLREGDRFAILAFDDMIERFVPELVPFSQATLARADAWLASIDARGGTEMREPLLDAVDLAPDGLVVLLTDGQVANEDQILADVLSRRSVRRSRVHSFGIGTNVSDHLLLSLADRTGGAVVSIFPGERIDEKVVAQFARMTALRVTDLRISFRGVEVAELAPAEPKALVDGEPFVLFGTFEAESRGAVEIHGRFGGESVHLEVPVDFVDSRDRPVIARLWAQARIRDLERASVIGRREAAMKQRIVALAKKHRVSSKFTSFLVVDERTGDRRSRVMPETRVVPVSAPFGWTMPSRARNRLLRAVPAASIGRPAFAMAAPPVPGSSAAIGTRGGSAADAPVLLRAEGDALAPMPSRSSLDPMVAILERQAASGLWEDPPRDPIASTVDALAGLVRLGASAAHATHGAQIRKAIDSVLALVSTERPEDPRVRHLLCAALLLLASGKRTRARITTLAASWGHLLGTEREVRADLERLA